LIRIKSIREGLIIYFVKTYGSHELLHHAEPKLFFELMHMFELVWIWNLVWIRFETHRENKKEKALKFQRKRKPKAAHSAQLSPAKPRPPASLDR
jgi:hypothetical protein